MQAFRNGYEPLPIVGPTAPGRSPGKRPGVRGWQSMIIDERMISSWGEGSLELCTNTGIRCGILRAADVDVLDVRLAAELRDLAHSILGPTPLYRIGRSPKFLLAYRVEKPTPKAETPELLLPDKTKAQVEMLGQGQQFVAYGTHPETGLEYTWPHSGPDVVPLFDLPLLKPASEVEFPPPTGRVLLRPQPHYAAAPVADFPSAAHTACTRPIDKLDAEARRQHAEDMRVYEQDQKAAKAAGDEPNATSQPRLNRYLVEGTTVEALSEVLRDDLEAKQRAPLGRVLLRQDEMSEWLANFDRYRGGGRGGGDRGAYLRLYNGGRYVVDRVGRGSFAVPSWSACMLGGIQPEPIQRIAREAADDGLLQRFIYCVPGPQNRGEDRMPLRAALDRYEALIPALAAFRPSRCRFGSATANDDEQTPPIVLAGGAHRHRHAVDKMVEAVAALPDVTNRLRAALGKWNGLFARLCLTFHMIAAADARLNAQDGPPIAVLHEDTAARVAALMRDVLLPHLLRAEALMFSSAQTGHARWIAGYILSKGQPRIAMRDLVQAYGPLRAPEARRERLEVMESLVAVGWLLPEPQSNPARDPAGSLVNPLVHTLFAARAERERTSRHHTRQRISESFPELLKRTP
ncbi:DUF3987 domain-containing protein [Falsiroseomonas sp. E2-1-a20]|uniref:DUF3987 domain-containing protein n=1 Tax=Falsiroseomonas sp. E2-1-a20 TaxID=3239300 RepID=UPI003F3E5471